MRRGTVITAVVVGLLALSGCSASYPVAFERAQTVGDIPDLDYVGWNLERESARFLAEDEGIQYFVARGDDETLCLIWVPIDHSDQAVSTCGVGGVAIKGSVGPKVELVIPDMGERPGWRKLAPNLYAED